MSPLDNIPALDSRPDMRMAMGLIEAAIEAMQPDGQLAERWEEYKGTILSWVRYEEAISPQALHGLRISLEGMAGDGETGEMLVAAVKLGMSAVLIAAPNPYCVLLHDRDPMHDDIAPLIEKAINLLHKAKVQEPFDPIVRVDYDIQERLEAKRTEIAAEAVEEQRKDWVTELIENAVRPENQN